MRTSLGYMTRVWRWLDDRVYIPCSMPRLVAWCYLITL